MTIENKTHRAAFPIKTLSVIVLTAAELQADNLTITVPEPQFTAVTKALLKDPDACHLLWRGPAADLLPALAAEPSGSPTHAFPSCMRELAAFSCNFTGSLGRAPFLSGFLLYQSGFASSHSRLCPTSQEEDYTSVPMLTYSRIWKRNYN